PAAIVEQHDALAGGLRASEHVADLESDAVARSGRLGDDRVAPIQPVEIAPEDVVFGQPRLGGLDVVAQQMRRENVVPQSLQAFADCAARGDAAAIAPHGAGKINFHSWRFSTLKSQLSSPRMKVKS